MVAGDERAAVGAVGVPELAGDENLPRRSHDGLLAHNEIGAYGDRSPP